ncbi:nucleophile aminohydrolase [Mycena sp. CBHHK59/15]|nr:nucleophile aminohydrolase [Mycena sp. CBHHK59/15]
MCRWFAYISRDEECLLEDILVTSKHSLSRQVHEHYLPKLLAHDPNRSTNEHEINARNAVVNIDGLGVAWYTSAKNDFVQQISGERPAMYKTASPPLNDFNFRNICANTATRTCFAHIRAASDTPVAATNNHPFVFGRHTIMHNGVVSGFLAIKRRVCDLLDTHCYANILGSTDSEHLAALYMTILTKGRGKESWEEQYPVAEMLAALRNAFGKIIDLQHEILGPKAEPNSLNVAVTDGRRLVAFRYRNSDIEVPPSLYFSTSAGVTLNRKYPDHPDEGIDNAFAVKTVEEHGKHIIVASEPSTYKDEDWNLIEKNQGISVDVDLEENGHSLFDVSV